MSSNPLLLVLFLLFAVVVPLAIVVVVAVRVSRARLLRRRGLGPKSAGSSLLASYHAAEARMAELQGMLDHGAITEEEYRERRRAIIDEIRG